MAVRRMELQDIPVDRDLLNPKFEQYKLSLDEIPSKEHPLLGRVSDLTARSSQSSLLQLRLISRLNALILDAWNPEHVYYVNQECQIVGYFTGQGADEQSSFIAASLPRTEKPAAPGPSCPVTFAFVDEAHAVAVAADGDLFLFTTGSRSCRPENPWQVCPVSYEKRYGRTLQHATSWIRQSLLVFEVAVAYIDGVHVDETTNGNGDHYKSDSTNVAVSLEWLTISQDYESNWTIERVRRLTSKDVPDYVAIENNGVAISVTGLQMFRFTYDSVLPVVGDELEEDAEISKAVEPDYTWMQTAEDVTVHFMVPPETKKDDLRFDVTRKTIQFRHIDGNSLLDGELFSQIDPESSTWTLSNNKIELILAKTSKYGWKSVVIGDENRGRLVYSEEAMADFNLRMAEISSDKWLTEKDVKTYNVSELEECDAIDESELQSNWTRFDGETHRATHKMDLCGNHFLFKSLTANRLPAACIRYDVDALMIEPHTPTSTDSAAWKHTGTFDALGYVLASKQQKKFVTCALDRSFAVTCDSNRNVFVYRSNFPVDSVLKNRKTGVVVKSIGKQHVYTLEKPGNILGLAANSHTVLVLKADSLVTLLVN